MYTWDKTGLKLNYTLPSKWPLIFNVRDTPSGQAMCLLLIKLRWLLYWGRKMYNFPKKDLWSIKCCQWCADQGHQAYRNFYSSWTLQKISAKIIQLHFSFVHQFSPMRFHILSLQILDLFRVSATRLVGTKKLFSCYVCHLFFVMCNVTVQSLSF